jgi:hypothetical protein
MAGKNFLCFLFSTEAVFLKVVKPCFFEKKDFFLTLANFYDQTCFFSYILFLEESSGAVDIDEYHIYAANRSTQLNGDS